MALEAGSRRVVADGTNSAERLEPDVAASTRPNRRKAPAAKNRSKQQLRPRVLVIFQGHRGDRESIDRRLVTAVSDQLVRHIETPREHTCLDVWLETPGGDAHVVYKLVLLLRSYASRLRVIIPDYAKSAGTLLAIAADEIYMAPAAELGPLDAQIGYEKEGMTISALDMARSLEDLAETAMIMALSGGGAVLEATRLSRSESLSAMVEFATKFMQPVVSKLDPTMIHWSSSLLQVAVHYATRLLDLREAVPEPFDKKDVTGLPTALVERYPAHGCVISRAEARQLGLPVFDLESYDRGADAIATHRRLEARHSNFVQILPLDAPDGQDADEDGEHGED